MLVEMATRRPLFLCFTKALDVSTQFSDLLQSAAGCMLVEMATGQPLFPGESDVEQLWLILQCLGPLWPTHAARLAANPAIAAMAAPPPRRRLTLQRRFPEFDAPTMELLVVGCLAGNGDCRASHRVRCQWLATCQPFSS